MESSSQVKENELTIFKVVRCVTSKISSCDRVHRLFCRPCGKLLGDAAMSENKFLYSYTVFLLDVELFLVELFIVY